MEGLHLYSEIHSGDLRHLDVRDKEVRRGAFSTLQGLEGIDKVLNLESAAVHDSTKNERDDWIIIHDKNADTFSLHISPVYS